ncbi:MAG: peptidylprolyl isomerase [Mesorhizobium sp.]
MTFIWKHIRTTAAALLVAGVALATPMTAPAQASEIKYVVNGIPVTSYDIQRRATMLKVFRQKGTASDEMVNQALKTSELNRRGIRISNEQVNAAFANFAGSNKMKPAQLEQVLNQMGVTGKHLKEFMRVQIGWSQLLGMRMRSSQSGGGMMTEQQMVKRVFELGGQKPSATEYMLQKVTFVVPARDRAAILAKRKREAESFRQRYNGCETARQFAKGLVDVTVQDIPRVLAPELPPDWEKQIKATKPGSATSVRETQTGIEFIGVCSSREVSDDRAAQMVLQADGQLDSKAEEMSDNYIAELKKSANIVNR